MKHLNLTPMRFSGVLMRYDLASVGELYPGWARQRHCLRALNGRWNKRTIYSVGNSETDGWT